MTWLRTLAVLVVISAPARAGVVINEIMYHPPDDRDEWPRAQTVGATGR